MIYENVKELADKKKISICELEKRAQLGNGVIAGWKTSSPRVENLQAVAKILGVTVNRLLQERKEQ